MSRLLRVFDPPRGRRSRRGQALVELAIVLPLLLAMAGITVDFARVYQGSIALRGAARAAAEAVVRDSTVATQAQAEQSARRLVCGETRQISGYAGSPPNCTAPTVSVTAFAVDPAAPGASSRFPLATATVSASIPFSMLFSWPLLTSNGAWTIEVDSTYSIIRNR